MTRCTQFAFLLMAILGIMHGCATDPTEGYSTETNYPTTVGSLAIPIFDNPTFYRGLEFDLTDALIKEIQTHTPYKITTQSKADSVLSGQIRHVELRQLSKSPLTGLTEEAIVRVTIDFQWRDLRTNKILMERSSFTGHGLFVPSAPTGEPIEIGQLSAIQLLVREVVGEMQAEW